MHPCCKSAYANIFLYKSFLQMEQSITHFQALHKARWRLRWCPSRSWWSPPSSASRFLWRRRSEWLLLPLVPARGCSSTGATFTREIVCLDAHVRHLLQKNIKLQCHTLNFVETECGSGSNCTVSTLFVNCNYPCEEVTNNCKTPTTVALTSVAPTSSTSGWCNCA